MKTKNKTERVFDVIERLSIWVLLGSAVGFVTGIAAWFGYWLFTK